MHFLDTGILYRNQCLRFLKIVISSESCIFTRQHQSFCSRKSCCRLCCLHKNEVGNDNSLSMTFTLDSGGLKHQRRIAELLTHQGVNLYYIFLPVFHWVDCQRCHNDFKISRLFASQPTGIPEFSPCIAKAIEVWALSILRTSMIERSIP